MAIYDVLHSPRPSYTGTLHGLYMFHQSLGRPRGTTKYQASYRCTKRTRIRMAKRCRATITLASAFFCVQYGGLVLFVPFRSEKRSDINT